MINSHKGVYVHALAVGINIIVAAKNANELTTTTVHITGGDVKSNVWQLVLCLTIHDVRCISIPTLGKPGKE